MSKPIFPRAALFLAALLLFATISGRVSGAVIALHFTGYSHQKPLKVKLIISHDDFRNPQIQYDDYPEKIPLSFLREEELRPNPNGPSLIQQEWEERYHNRKTGRYIMVSQGAVVYHFVYLRYRDMKVIFFDQDTDSAP